MAHSTSPCLTSNPSFNTFRLICVNDIYTFEKSAGHGGFDSAATKIRQLREEVGGNSIVSVNGDFLGGSALAVKSSGLVNIELMNEMDIDIVVVGNHEFDYGPEVLKERIAASKFTWLAANIVDTKTEDLLQGTVRTHIHTTTDGLRVGFFGVCTTRTSTLSYPGPTIKFLDPIEASKAAVAELKKRNVHLIVGITHLRLSLDERLAGQVPGIDVLLGGHDHEPYAAILHDTLTFKCGQNAYWVGTCDIAYSAADLDNGAAMPRYLSWAMHSTHASPPQRSCAAIVDRFRVAAEADLHSLADMDTAIATVTLEPLVTLSRRLRTCETNAGNLVADAMFDHYARLGGRPSLAVVNGGFIRGDRVYSVGEPLTRRILYEEMPFPRLTTLLEISGEHLVRCLEQQVRFVPEAAGCFPHLSANVRAVVDASAAPMQRVRSLRVDGVDVAPQRRYRVATTEFVALGGDGCSAFAFGVAVTEFPLYRGGGAGPHQVVADVAVDYLVRTPRPDAVVQGRLVLTGTGTEKERRAKEAKEMEVERTCTSIV